MVLYEKFHFNYNGIIQFMIKLMITMYVSLFSLGNLRNALVVSLINEKFVKTLNIESKNSNKKNQNKFFKSKCWKSLSF